MKSNQANEIKAAIVAAEARREEHGVEWGGFYRDARFTGSSVIRAIEIADMMTFGAVLPHNEKEF
jgi:hypothetical protein